MTACPWSTAAAMDGAGMLEPTLKQQLRANMREFKARNSLDKATAKEIKLQEASQLAAWISQNPPKARNGLDKGHRSYKPEKFRCKRHLNWQPGSARNP
ncbi:hypothetical protein MAPG_07334 [Magnaporthiopsis poae ATCC 64411]|uniref:Uncharacterized protein n=1 Tax=Magnaporthiopsis poae (strain ATCC 64411 / 73-15) TaxID=644358 RepID=A0A0C4E4E1_MAGP6|nr:hypothetical protein MAPG_07334 [Magnaporthiopsis poae ATCC 64411]